MNKKFLSAMLQVQNGLSRKMVFGYATVRRLPLKL